MQVLDVGEVADLISGWYDGDGDAAEPSAITLTVTKPDGTELSYTKTDMTGSMSDGSAVLDVWAYAQSVDAAGVWRYTFAGTVASAPVTQPEQVFLVGIDDRPKPCEPWCTWDDVEAAARGADLSTIDSATREAIIDSATWLLFGLSGQVYPGICQTTQSLCFSCRRCAPLRCRCEPSHVIPLAGNYPVWGVWDVTIEGEVLSPTAYVLRQRRELVRIDGDPWPLVVDPYDPRDPEHFSATWAYGRRPPVAGQRAAAALAADVARGELNLDCTLPTNVQTIVRQGVQYELLDPAQELTDALLGLTEVDRFLTAERYARKHRPTLVASPDTLLR